MANSEDSRWAPVWIDPAFEHDCREHNEKATMPGMLGHAHAVGVVAELGDTEFGAPAARQPAPAWSPTHHTDQPDLDTVHDGRWSWRPAVGVAALTLAVLGVAAAGVRFGGPELQRHHRAQSAPALIKPAPAPVKPKPPIPPEAMLNGQYRVTVQDSKATYLHSSASQWSSGSADYVGYIAFSTRCTGSGCVATSMPPSNPLSSGKTVQTLAWVAGKWLSRPDPMPDGDGIDNPTTVLYPDGHGGFRGTTTDTIVSGPHAGAQLSAPILLTPRFDPENL